MGGKSARNTRNFFRSVAPGRCSSRRSPTTAELMKESFSTKHACFHRCWRGAVRRGAAWRVGDTGINGLRETAVKIARLLARGARATRREDSERRGSERGWVPRTRLAMTIFRGTGGGEEGSRRRPSFLRISAR